MNHCFSKKNLKTLKSMNVNKLYGSQWIKNINELSDKQEYKLYPTGEYEFNSGRIYVALPASKIISEEDKKKYNIM